MGRRWAQWVGDDLLFRLGVTPVCKCCIRTPWENERLPTAASKRNRNVKTLWCCNVRIWNVGSDRLMVLISFGWIREQCHLAYIMTKEWSQLPTTLQCRAAAVRVNAASYWQSVQKNIDSVWIAGSGQRSQALYHTKVHFMPLPIYSLRWIKELSAYSGRRVSHCHLQEWLDKSSIYVCACFEQNISLCTLVSVASPCERRSSLESRINLCLCVLKKVDL